MLCNKKILNYKLTGPFKYVNIEYFFIQGSFILGSTIQKIQNNY